MFDNLEILRGTITNLSVGYIILLVLMMLSLLAVYHFALGRSSVMDLDVKFDVSLFKLRTLFIAISLGLVVGCVLLIKDTADEAYGQELKEKMAACVAKNRDCRKLERLMDRLEIERDYGDYLWIR